MTQPSLTTKQKTIISLLLKFRYLTVNQLLKYFHHKDPHRIKEWLTDLKEKGYIAVISDESDPTKPYIFCLSTKAKHFEESKNYSKKFLERLYKEKTLSGNFINHCLFIFDIYQYFLSQKEKNSTLHFLTQQDLTGYDFFPEELPDAYIAVETKEGTEKYFLDLFDDYRKPAGVTRFTLRKYITYCEDGSWQANTENSPFPSLLFVLADQRRKKHIHMYGRAKLEKTFEDISLFLTTQDTIRFSKSTQNIWLKVE
ncbi:MAG: hypothetical protein WD992_00870 [Candidatus Levyibacteriota bacterium]